MRVQRSRRSLLCAATALALIPIVPTRAQPAIEGVWSAYGPRFRDANSAPRRRIRSGRPRATDGLREWHAIALECTGLDHTPPAIDEARVFGEQLGPGRSSRAMAIVHIAIFDALNAMAHRYRGYLEMDAPIGHASAESAVAQAAHDTLVALFPSQRADLDEALMQDLALVRDPSARTRGIDLGQRAAAAILADRANDGSNHGEPRIGVDYFPGGGPGQWRPDPISQSPIALGARWAEVKPFVLRAADQFRTPRPPALDSAAYATAYEEVKRLGGDGSQTPTVRSELQSQIGIYWAYDGMPSLCAPPRLYNQIALQIAETRTPRPLELARLLALVNIAMADAGIAIWESKYFYSFWRPVTGIREAQSASLIADPGFVPLGAPASNLTGPNFTPPFPAYPSGHAGFGAALFQVLREIYGTDRIPFRFVSDELNGATLDNLGHVRPRVMREFSRLSDAEEENGQSRIYLGIHWAFDKTEGIAQGRRVARFVVNQTLTPL